MPIRIAILLLSSVWLACFACRGAESGGVLVVGLTNGIPVLQVGTNDYYRDKLSRGLSKKTIDVELAQPKAWRKSYEQFSKALVKEARAAGLDAASLEKLLRKTLRAGENKGLAVMPVAVHQTQHNGEPLWIVTLKWEVEKEVLKGSALEHIRYFWFNRSSLKQLDFFTCA